MTNINPTISEDHLYGITPKELKELLKKNPKLMKGNTLRENVAIPTYEVAGNECVIGGPSTNFKQAEVQLKNVNAYITIGYDRESHLFTGYGGKGGIDCAAIDICAGSASSLRKILGGAYNEQNVVGKLMASDASRIYISQKADIDHYFGLPATNNHGSTEAQAAIAIKSDNVRVIGRHTVKICAMQGAFQGVGIEGEVNSQSGKIRTSNSIELIAGEVNMLQPVVKGTNLIKCLLNIYDHIGKLYQRLIEDSTDQLQFQVQSIASFHPSTPVVTFPDPISGISAGLGMPNTIMAMLDRVTTCLNSELDKAEFLGMGPRNLEGDSISVAAESRPGLKDVTKQFAMKSEKYILSNSVYTT